MNPPPHRKRVKHLNISGHAHELTFSCYRRFPLLKNDEWCMLLSKAIGRAIAKQGFNLLAFVYMPEHVHMLVLPACPDASISSLLAAIKRPFSWRVKQCMQATADPWLGRLTVRDRPGKTTFRFWQEGSGYDRNIVEPSTLQQVAEYFHANPIRRGLCTHPGQWRWSSWQHYHGDLSKLQALPPVDGRMIG